MAANPVRWFEIYVQDMTRARSFYETVFRTALTPMEPASPDMDYWTFPPPVMDQPGTSGALIKMEGAPSGGMGTMVYFGCDDCAVEAARAEQAGGSILRPKQSIGPHGFIALVYDTEGNLIGLHSLR